MQTSPKPEPLNKPKFSNRQTVSQKTSFFDSHSSDILAVSFGALAIVVFLSVAFAYFDATSLPPSHSALGVNNQGVISKDQDHGEINSRKNDPDLNQQNQQNQPEPTEDLVASANPSLCKTPFQFCTTSASSSHKAIYLNATFTPDNTMWRYTSDGWRDISMAADPPQSNKPLLEGVHPVIWTAMLLLSSLLLLIMASSDEEVKKLLGRSSDQKTL